MSLKKSNTRRIGLLGGSSVIAASLSAAVSIGAGLTPTAALAYDECTPAPGTGTLTDGPDGVSDPSLNGGAADTFNCPGGFPPPTITYTPTGTLTVNIPFGAHGGDGAAVRINPGAGDAVVNNTGFDLIAGAGLSEGADWTVELGAAAGFNTTFNNAGRVFGRRYWDVVYAGEREYVGGQAIRGSGAGDVVVNNSDWIRGRVNFSDLGGSATLNVLSGAIWESTGDSTFGAGADRLAIAEGGIVNTGYVAFDEGVVENVVVTINFGGGADTFSNAGTFAVHPRGGDGGNELDGFEAETLLLNLERFENSGVIVLGSIERAITRGGLRRTIDTVRQTDGWYDDILSMPGATFEGLAGSRIVLDVNLNNTQLACDGALRNSDGDMPAADCVAIIGGSTSGSTLLTVNDLVPSDRGGTNEIVLIDVSGGESAAGDFVLDPDSEGYSDAHGGVIDKGFFFYPLIYDESTQQHKLVGVVGEDGMQFPILAQAAQALWRTSTGTWLSRQADLRGHFDEGISGGVWLRTSAEFANRDTLQSVTGAGSTFDFANTYDQNSYAITGGVDLISAGTDTQAFVLGVMAGYASATLESERDLNTSEMNGWTGGVYASYLAGGLFVDAAVNANKVMLESDVPRLNIFPAGSLLRTDVLSVGAEAEAGWRFPLTDAAFVEPLVNLSYVRTSSDLLEIKSPDASRPRIGLDFDDPVSFRAALGARLGLDQDYGPIHAQLSVLGRVWNEFEGETAVIVTSRGPTTSVTDDLTGQFTEVGLGASVYGMDGAVSGFINLGGKFGDDYEARTASIGVRVAW